MFRAFWACRALGVIRVFRVFRCLGNRVFGVFRSEFFLCVCARVCVCVCVFYIFFLCFGKCSQIVRLRAFMV